ncbi:hypothetical protein V6N12_057232 [Hibiscus sabdariffa]|uniref:Uncharacterized protein n=1 Tax=Hibiscus sabdariffa TaxID=183260 RepID=A0ABR2DB90_9ROSI
MEISSVEIFKNLKRDSSLEVRLRRKNKGFQVDITPHKARPPNPYEGSHQCRVLITDLCLATDCKLSMEFVPSCKASSTNLLIGRAVIPESGGDVDVWTPVFNIHDPTGTGCNGFSPNAKHLLDSQDGLMLFQHPSESENKYVLWNPNTEQFLLVPRPRNPETDFRCSCSRVSALETRQGDGFV